MVRSPREQRCFRVRSGLLISAAMLLMLVNAPLSFASSNSAQSVEPPFGTSLTIRVSHLFHAIATDSLTVGEPLFFPESAYVAMKTGRIPAPAGDYQDRLLAFFRLDLGAYHAALFAHGPATFVGVNANAADAAWVAPGACENSIGYWHVPGVRLVYRVKGMVRSVAIASLISWRGVWYVVHLGPNPRPTNVGTVDAPSLGRGVAGPPGGC
jgi:hypothetical protein